MFKPNMHQVVKVLDSSEGKGLKIEVIEYQTLPGLYTEHTDHQYIEKLRQVRVLLKNGELITESGALQFMKGDVTMKVDSSLKSAARGILSNKLTGETSVKPRYTGNGEIYLEPSFDHFLVFEMDNEEIVADKGVFYCCESSIAVGVAAQRNISSALAGGEGLFQTRLTGSGICVIQCNVPIEHILIYQLDNETLQVDGNYALLRRGKINFTVEKSTKSWIGTARSGEGLLQTFRGTGEVWIIPTLKNIQEAMLLKGLLKKNSY
jgi:uncharacterized protein (AIM24 family)